MSKNVSRKVTKKSVKLSSDELIKIACEAVNVQDVSSNNELNTVEQVQQKLNEYIQKNTEPIISKKSEIKDMLEQIKQKRDLLKQLKINVSSVRFYNKQCIKQVSKLSKTTLTKEQKQERNKQIRMAAKQRKSAKKEEELRIKQEEDQLLKEAINAANIQRQQMEAEIQMYKQQLAQKDAKIEELTQQAEEFAEVKEQDSDSGDMSDVEESECESDDDELKPKRVEFTIKPQTVIQPIYIEVEGKKIDINQVKKNKTGEWMNCGKKMKKAEIQAVDKYYQDLENNTKLAKIEAEQMAQFQVEVTKTIDMSGDDYFDNE